MDYIQTETPPKRVRSALLTVLCILSILGGLYRIATGTAALIGAKTAASMQKEFNKSKEEVKAKKEKDPNDKEAAFTEKMMSEAGMFLNEDFIRKNAMISIGTAILTILGAVLMLMMKRAGFWTYVVGTVAEVALPLTLLGVGLLTGISTAVTGFFGLVFIVLYAFCLKEMKPEGEEV